MVADMETSATRIRKEAVARAVGIARDLDPDPDRLRALADALDEILERDSLDRFLDAWGLSNAEAARIFGVSRQAIGSWRAEGAPVGRADSIADLAAATDLLGRYVKRERIPAVVRRSAEALGGRSLLDIAREGDHAEVRRLVEAMFDLRRVQP